MEGDALSHTDRRTSGGVIAGPAVGMTGGWANLGRLLALAPRPRGSARLTATACLTPSCLAANCLLPPLQASR